MSSQETKSASKKKSRKKMVLIFGYDLTACMEQAKFMELDMSQWIFCHDITQLANVTLQTHQPIFLKYWQRGRESEFIAAAERLGKAARVMD